MTKPSALPAHPDRTMLWPVLGSSLFHGPRVAARWLRAAALGVGVLAAVLPTHVAQAQDADDGGWFDAPPPAEPAPDQYDTEPTSQTLVGDPAPQQTEIADNDPSALTTFRPTLDPYGAWVDDGTYGTVWVPNRDVVGPDFAPYVSSGHWALTADNDWIWQSDYPFGWAVFHYGRWVWISGHGWAWVPGRTYANAWVVWRVPTAGYAYVGWAPMPPTWGWRYGYAYSLWYSPPLPYVFCPSAYVFDYRVHYHIVHDRHLVHEIASHSHVYPTPYRTPARPTVHGTAPVRADRLPATAPRGPAISAARVPAHAVPISRTAPPVAAARLSPTRMPTRVTPQSVRDTSTNRVWTNSSSPTRPAPLPTRNVPTRAFTPPASRDLAPVRSSAPVRVTPRTDFAPPRSSAPTRAFSPAPSRSFSPAPSRSFSPAPTRSFSPATPRMHGGGGGGRRR